MDLSKLAGTLLGSDSIKGVSKATGVSSKNVTSILQNALPSLLSGIGSQAKNSDTSEGFATALADHAKADTSDLSGFFKNIDLTDGSKIIDHLLGDDKNKVAKSAAKNSGVPSKSVSNVLSAAGPLLMSLIGKQTEEEDDKEQGIGGMISSLVDNVDLGSILGGLTGGSSSSSSSSSKPASGKTGGIGNLLGGVMNFFKKK